MTTAAPTPAIAARSNVMGSSDTIFAAATGAGRAAIAVIRLSGPRSRAVLEGLAPPVPEPRRLALRVLRSPGTGEPLDEALVAWLPGPASFTGEDMAELHIHGGLAVRGAVLRALASFEGCRAAEPGEFTRRAFLNGRLGLDRVEGLADLIDAETEAQRRQALRQLEGALGRQVEAWRERLIGALALMEAALDFADEGDVPAGLEREAATIAATLRPEIERSLADGGRGERLRDGFTVVLAGPPNAGKSTLLNALARRDVAIVSPVAGTTRDAIEVRCELDGLPVTFVDTAGLRETADPVEQEGVRRSRARLEGADLVLWLTAPDAGGEETPRGHLLRVGAKGDLPQAGALEADLVISARTGQGLDRLLDRIRAEAEAALGAGDAVITRERHRIALTRCAEALARSAEALAHERSELAAEDLRLALHALGTITGQAGVEDVLDRLFASFCIGK